MNIKRKVVQQGTSTLMVSLPAKWVQKHEITKGAEVYIEEREDSVAITAEPTHKKKETLITIKSKTESVVRTIITNAYRNGYDKITIQLDNEEQLHIIHDTIKTRLVGFEIIKNEKHVCIVENITEPTEDRFDTLIKKIFYNVAELFELTKKRIETGKIRHYEDIEERIHRYDNFCKRVISKRGLPGGKTELVWLFLSLVTYGQREIYLIHKFLDQNKGKVNK